MIIVTGGAGFIGSNLIASLNQLGHNNILLVDNLSNVDKIPNLQGLEVADYMDKHEFLELVESGQSLGQVDCVFHQGACSDTMADDGEYVMRNNFTYSKLLYDWCRQYCNKFIYASSASVYGDNKEFIESAENEKALNAYAYSKLLFDNYIRQQHQNEQSLQVVGLRYFNVYGPRESHKGRMASVAFHFLNQLKQQGYVNLFEGNDGFGHGQQIRDFVYIKDVVKVNLHFFNQTNQSGIFNLGTGKGQTFNDVALAAINTYRHQRSEPVLTLQQAIDSDVLRYVPMPEKLLGKYQSYTQADLTNLRELAGYEHTFSDVNTGVSEYVNLRLHQE